MGRVLLGFVLTVLLVVFVAVIVSSRPARPALTTETVPTSTIAPSTTAPAPTTTTTRVVMDPVWP